MLLDPVPGHAHSNSLIQPQISGNNSYSNMNNYKQVLQQQQKDAKLAQRLCAIVDSL